MAINVFASDARTLRRALKEGGDEKPKLYSEAIDSAGKEARKKVLKISDQQSTYNNEEESQLNMVMQYLTENPFESMVKIVEGLKKI